MIKKTEAIRIMIDYITTLQEELDASEALGKPITGIDLYIKFSELKEDIIYDICDAKEA